MEAYLLKGVLEEREEKREEKGKPDDVRVLFLEGKDIVKEGAVLLNRIFPSRSS